jgi:hypothetical protein
MRENYCRSRRSYLPKGTVSRDFLLQVFFHESSSPKPLKVTLGSLQLLQKFAEIFASQGANLQPVLTTNFATGTAGVVDTGGK